MRPATLTIPQPCAESWDAMTPTAAGRHCASCQTEVVDFARLSEAEVLAYLRARPGQRVCGRMAAPITDPQHYKRRNGLRRWLLVATAFLTGHSLAASELPPQKPPLRLSFFKLISSQNIITIRGVVVDDSLNRPVPGAHVFIAQTKFGAVANERGEFVLTFPANWVPAGSSVVKLRVAGIAFVLAEQIISVPVESNSNSSPLIVRLASVPERGYVKGKAVGEAAPVPPSVLSQQTTTISGIVLDSSLNTPVAGARIFIDGTKYGAVTDMRGEFVLTLRSEWKQIKNDILKLEVSAGHFVYKSQTVELNLATDSILAPVSIRLVPVPVFTVGKIHLSKPPVPPPGSRKQRP